MKLLDQLRLSVGLVDRPVQEASTSANVGAYMTPLGMLPQGPPVVDRSRRRRRRH